MRVLVLRGLVTFILISLSLPLGRLEAQEARATIGGRVMDSQGGLVPNATVQVVNDDTNVKRDTKTNEKGAWIVEFLLPGHYEFTISATGFKSETRKGITLQTADDKQLDTQLQLGASSQTVEV